MDKDNELVLTELVLTSESDVPTSGSEHDAAAAGTDRDLVIAMRAGRNRALRTFYLRFRPVLLNQAYRLGVRNGEREDIVTEFLGDIAIKLVSATSTPQSLAAYVITSFRHAILDARRKQDRTRARHTATYDGGEGAAETDGETMVSLCSEYSLRAVRGIYPALDDTPDVALLHLAMRLFVEVNERDRELLTWLGERVPASVIATWRGTTQNAVKVKISRLRARLRVVAAAYLHEADAETRQALERFFLRAGVVLTPTPVVKTMTPAAARRIAHLSDVTEQSDYVSPYGPEVE